MKTILIRCLPLLLFFSPTMNAQDSDKVLHAAAGFGISAVTYTIVKSTTKNRKKALIWSFVTSTAAGIAKELIDSGEEGNKFDAVDALATTGGGIVGGFTMHLILNDKKKRTAEINEIELAQEAFFALDAEISAAQSP
ncbi:hypothetical protein ABN763_08040 [Spongiivirga sp. MCCC 1A20706]|uniref:hypothetical protein n=1 Tax=Spongiivirga sp. MCCC 1A20706 TaxID=3160963 RepID=UPI003977D25C